MALAQLLNHTQRQGFIRYFTDPILHQLKTDKQARAAYLANALMAFHQLLQFS